MKLTRTTGITLAVGIFIIAALGLYMLYQGEVKERQAAEASLANARAVVPALITERDGLETKLSQLKAELANWQSQIAGLGTELAQAISALSQTQASFPVPVESIEYDEALFRFALANNLEVARLSATEPAEEEVAGITYSTTSLILEVRGETADILDLVNTIVTDAEFQTAILQPINITVPQPLTDEQKAEIEEEIRTKLTAEAIAELTTQDILGFMLEAIETVTGQRIETRTAEEMAATIRAEIAGSVEAYVLEFLPGELAALILEHIKDSIVDKMIEPLAEEIYGLIVEVGEGQSLAEALEGLLGKDIAGLLGEEIAGMMPGNIAGLLKEYIAQLIEEKMMAQAAAVVEDSVQTTTAKTIKDMEMPQATITLVIYSYQGGQNG